MVVREDLVEALRLDLVGPGNDHAFAHELLPEAPSRWYLSGFLVPSDAPEEQRVNAQSDDELDSGVDSDGDDATAPEQGAARKSYLPSSLGLSVLAPPGTTTLTALAVWGDSEFQGKRSVASETDAPQGEADDAGAGNTASTTPKRGYRRNPHDEAVPIGLPEPGARPVEFVVPNSGGMKIVVTCRPVTQFNGLPAGTLSVSVFRVNSRRPDPDHGYRAFAFQAGLILKSPEPYVPRPDPRGIGDSELTEEWDEQVADLQFRDVYEYAVGHGVAAEASVGSDGIRTEVRSVWIPSAEVERVEAAQVGGVTFEMERLGELADGDSASNALSSLVQQYRDWITAQRTKSASLPEKRKAVAKELLVAAEHAGNRIEAGIAMLKDPDQLMAFCLANRTMAAAARRREAQRLACKPDDVDPPRWRPFQLAYVLMTLRGVADPLHGDRDVVDLLFFPPGGGKTEAHLGLAALTMVLRRLRNPGLRSCGVSVLMRYTLRLPSSKASTIAVRRAGGSVATTACAARRPSRDSSASARSSCTALTPRERRKPVR